MTYNSGLNQKTHPLFFGLSQSWLLLFILNFKPKVFTLTNICNVLVIMTHLFGNCHDLKN